jgi:hypothetical protein
MLRSTSNSQHPSKWAAALRREMQTAIGRQLRVECELPQEMAPELAVLLTLMREERVLQSTDALVCGLR